MLAETTPLSAEKLETVILYIMEDRIPDFSAQGQKDYLAGLIDTLFMCNQIDNITRKNLTKKWVFGQNSEINQAILTSEPVE